MLIDVHGHLGRVLPDRREFVDEFQDKLLFGTDSCRRSDVESTYPNILFIKDLREHQRLPEAALEKIEWHNAVRLLGLSVARRG